MGRYGALKGVSTDLAGIALTPEGAATLQRAQNPTSISCIGNAQHPEMSTRQEVHDQDREPTDNAGGVYSRRARRLPERIFIWGERVLPCLNEIRPGVRPYAPNLGGFFFVAIAARLGRSTALDGAGRVVSGVVSGAIFRILRPAFPMIINTLLRWWTLLDSNQ